jgi:hypothetical protein
VPPSQHLELISNLLEQLNLTDLKQRPDCREPLEHLEHALCKAVVLVESGRDTSYLYFVAMGWVYVTKFCDYQDEIEVKVQKNPAQPPFATGTCSCPGRSKDLAPPKP